MEQRISSTVECTPPVQKSMSKSVEVETDWASLVAQWVKNPPAMQETQETWVRSLGWEDPLEQDMATHSSILAWRIRWTKESGRSPAKGLQRVRHDCVTEHRDTLDRPGNSDFECLSHVIELNRTKWEACM